jgi:hypothetical protein
MHINIGRVLMCAATSLLYYKVLHGHSLCFTMLKDPFHLLPGLCRGSIVYLKIKASDVNILRLVYLYVLCNLHVCPIVLFVAT